MGCQHGIGVHITQGRRATETWICTLSGLGVVREGFEQKNDMIWVIVKKITLDALLRIL